MPRTVTILFPDGKTEYWFTGLIFDVGDKLGRNGEPWIVTSVGEPDSDGTHTTITLRHDGDSPPGD